MEKIIVLVRPESSSNIGAVCRVMANTGLNSLTIAGKKKITTVKKLPVLQYMQKRLKRRRKQLPKQA